MKETLTPPTPKYAIQANCVRGGGCKPVDRVHEMRKSREHATAPCFCVNQAYMSAQHSLCYQQLTSFWNDLSLAGSGKLDSKKCHMLGHSRSTTHSDALFLSHHGFA